MDVEDDEVEMVLHQGQEPLELHQGQEPLELHQEPLEMHQEPLELHQEPLELHQEPMELHQEPVGPVVVELPQARRTVPLLDTSFHTEVRLKQDVYFSVAEPEPPGAATFRAAPEPEPIFFWSEPGAGAAFFKAAPAASFRQAKKKSLVLVSNMTLRAV